MKVIYPLLIFTGLLAVGAGLIISGTGCDEIKAPCDIEATQDGSPWLSEFYLESWSYGDGWSTIRFVYPKEVVTFVCTDRMVSYTATLKKRAASTVFTVLPYARLIWKYAAPSPSTAVLQGGGPFKLLFSYNSETEIQEERISLAYVTTEFGGVFIPGLEIQIPSQSTREGDFQYLQDHFAVTFTYHIKYKLTY